MPEWLAEYHRNGWQGLNRIIYYPNKNSFESTTLYLKRAFEVLK